MKCPRDGGELRRHDETERWRCHECRGAAISMSELVRSLTAVAPDLVATEGKTTVETTTRTSGKAVPCPACTTPMTPVSFEIFEIDRCFEDDLLWFDDWEHVSVMSAAHNAEKHQRLRELLKVLLAGGHATASPPPPPEPVPPTES